MIHYKVGDILQNVTSGVLLHGCNIQGIMGAGVAKGIRELYPNTYKEYKDVCTHQLAYLGTILPTKEISLTIMNAFTQQFTGGSRAVSYDAIDDIFHSIYCSGAYDNLNKDIHTVKIGAGLGGGSWKVIEQIILTHLPEHCNLYVWDFK